MWRPLLLDIRLTLDEPLSFLCLCYVCVFRQNRKYLVISTSNLFYNKFNNSNSFKYLFSFDVTCWRETSDFTYSLFSLGEFYVASCSLLVTCREVGGDLNSVIFIIALFSSVKKLISLNRAHINFSSAAQIKYHRSYIFSKQFFDK